MQQETPGKPDGYVWAATALRRLGRGPALRQLLAQALLRFPEHPDLLAMAAGKPRPDRTAAASEPGPPEPTQEIGALRPEIQQAVKRADWPAVVSLSASLRATAPDDPYAFQIGARALRELRRLRQADLLSHTGLSRFADHPGLLLERALTLHKQTRLEEALVCYDRLRALQPELASGYARSASVIVLLGKFDDAEAVLRDGLVRFPDDVGLLVQCAITATRRRDFTLARARWEEVRQRAPDDPRLARFAGEIALAEQFESLQPGADAESDDATGAAGAELTDAEVMKRFEGLGGNCEFGLAQRAAGIEPLGLLRFASTSAPELAALLRCAMQDVGSEEQTRLYLNAGQEYMLEDPRFFRTHTFINYGETDPAELLDKLRRRTVFLRNKLLSELRRGSKICLFRPFDGRLADGEITELHAALRTVGPAPLVCIRNAPEGDGTVTLTQAGGGLIVATMPGHSSKLSLRFIQTERYPYWIDLCRKALAANGTGPVAEPPTPTPVR
jgi:tetratricopeptide (TPR) repeat protein